MNTADVVNDIAYSERSWNQITEAPANNSDTDNKDEMNVFTVESNYNPNVTTNNSNVKLSIKDASNSETSI